MEFREGLSLAEEVDGGVGLGDGSEELEEVAEAAEAEEGELGAGVAEAGFESESDFAVEPLPVQRVD